MSLMINWSRKTMLLNALFFWPAVFLGGYVLWGKSSAMFWVYVAIWLGIIVIGRYFVCRRCKYYGVDCPTFGFSYLVRVFRRDESKGFSWRGCVIDMGAHVVALLLPGLAWIFSAFDVVVSQYETVDHVLMGVYTVLALSMMVVHSVTGCSKCDIAECRVSRTAKELKPKTK